MPRPLRGDSRESCGRLGCEHAVLVFGRGRAGLRSGSDADGERARSSRGWLDVLRAHVDPELVRVLCQSRCAAGRGARRSAELAEPIQLQPRDERAVHAGIAHGDGPCCGHRVWIGKHWGEHLVHGVRAAGAFQHRHVLVRRARRMPERPESLHHDAGPGRLRVDVPRVLHAEPDQLLDARRWALRHARRASEQRLHHGHDEHSRSCG